MILTSLVTKDRTGSYALQIHDLIKFVTYLFYFFLICKAQDLGYFFFQYHNKFCTQANNTQENNSPCQMFANQTFHRMNCLACSLADNANANTDSSITSLKLSNYSTHSTSKRAWCFHVKGYLEITKNLRKI